MKQPCCQACAQKNSIDRVIWNYMYNSSGYGFSAAINNFSLTALKSISITAALRCDSERQWEIVNDSAGCALR